jgi:hypothetical protein
MDKVVVAVLEELTSFHPAPAFIRADNAPTFIAQPLGAWCEVRTMTSTAYNEPGSAWQNCFDESFNGRFCDGFLSTESFTTAQQRDQHDRVHPLS